MKSGRKIVDLTGKRFGRLTVIKLDSTNIEARWICLCRCGNQKIIRASQLKTGGTKSCGCLRLEKLQKRCWKGCGELSGTHWKSILNHAKDREIEVLITIKDAWDKFLKQDKKCSLTGLDIFLSKTFSSDRKSHLLPTTASLDRIDSSKPYTIDNIQWVHKTIQGMKMNMSQSDFISFCKHVAKHN